MSWDQEFPYEIHFTLDVEDYQIEKLQQECDTIPNTKLILLDLYRKDVTTQQVTTSTYVPAGTSYQKVAAELKMRFRLRLGLDLIRTKYETVPWHPYIEMANPKLFDRKKLYFETHYKWLIPTSELPVFRNSFPTHALTRLSRNTLKHPVNGETAIMGTVRTYGRTYESHKDVLEQEEKLFPRTFIKKVSEFAFHDTNRKLDMAWLRR